MPGCGRRVLRRCLQKNLMRVNISGFDDMNDRSMEKAPITETEQAAAEDIDIDAIHKALANPTRRQILQWLKEPEQHFADQEYPLDLGVCAGLIDRRAGLSQSTVSAHLATLQRAGLLNSRRVGPWIFFRRNEALIQRFLAQLHDGL
jgi:ArsR family transcriptional regulator